jgi:endonuclease/exonuclease/phosphatase family metal-dependent hydrolase/regulation of enolase protein 1 (concanavalin A-like superfamily)
MLIRNVSVLGFSSMLMAGAASAQTTLTLSAPDTEVTDAYIRGGAYANTVHNNDALATKAYATTETVRRALLKFDTETRIPQGAQIQSASLTLTLKRSDPETRRIGVYRVTNSFQEHQATWYTRESGYRWTSAGSDLSSRLTDFSIGTTIGTKVTVDVTSVVQSTVNGSYGSRYTRLALVDIGSSSNTSYKEFYSSETGTAANRPVLTVVYGDSTNSGGGSLPSGWQSSDIGAVGMPGAASGSSSLITVSGAGADVWGTSDAFHYAYQSLAGNGTITARVSSLLSQDAWTKAGVMVRASTAANAAHAFMLVSEGKGLAFQRRSATGSASSHTSGGSGSAPRWVRLARDGNLVTAYTSSDGSSWATVGSATVTLPSTVLVGLAVSSHVTSGLATASFDNITVEAITPTPPPPTGSTLKVLDWNTQYSGMRTDGRFDPDGIINHIVRLNPDVISLNEVTKFYRYDTSRDFSVYFTQQLTARTGRTWYSYFRTDNGASTGVGNMVLSRFPIASTSYCQLSARRVAVNAAIYVNGRLLNVWSTHLDSSSTSNTMRLAEVNALHACVGSFAEQKIVAGDFNAYGTASELTLMKTLFVDGWLEADVSPTADAVSYPGNTSFGATRNSRIDFVFYSKTATNLVVQRAEVFDTRDANGVMASDHKPLMLTFEVR